MEESFENLNGVSEVVSGYSGGKTKNPTYKEVTYGDTGHFETIEVIYDSSVISYEKLLDNFWINIDPFDEYGQFCDKGYSYRSVAFYQSKEQKIMILKDYNKYLSFMEKYFSNKNAEPLPIGSELSKHIFG